MLPFQKGVGEVSHKQQNLPVILTSLQFRTLYDLATLFLRNFSFCELVDSKMSFILIAVLRRRVDV